MRLSAFISENMEQILQEWENFARTLKPSADTMDREALRDHAKIMLDAIIKDMGQKQTDKQQSEKSKGKAPKHDADTAAESHADVRLFSGYTIEQIVSEFRALRASVLRLWATSHGEKNKVDVIDINRFNEAIDQSLSESVARYAQSIITQQNLFLSILGNDLRNPLTKSISGASLIMSTTYIATQHYETAKQIFGSSQKLLKLVNDLLDFTRAQLGFNLPIQRQKTNIVNICLGAIEELRVTHPRHVVEFASEGICEGILDEGRIAQVFSTLIENAMRHGLKSSPVKVHLQSNNDEVTIRINNRGKAIDKAKLESMFDPLVRFKDPTTRETSFGIGLYIAHQVVRSHNGHIEIESSEKRGTTFTVSLPLLYPDTT